MTDLTGFNDMLKIIRDQQARICVLEARIDGLVAVQGDTAQWALDVKESLRLLQESVEHSNPTVESWEC